MPKDEKPQKPTSNQVPSEVKPKIMTVPLPKIFDEIEDSIRLSNEAAIDARKAAEEARKAGEKAANEAARVAAEAISRVERTAKEALELARLLKSTITEATAVIDKKLR